MWDCTVWDEDRSSSRTTTSFPEAYAKIGRWLCIRPACPSKRTGSPRFVLGKGGNESLRFCLYDGGIQQLLASISSWPIFFLSYSCVNDDIRIGLGSKTTCSLCTRKKRSVRCCSMRLIIYIVWERTKKSVKANKKLWANCNWNAGCNSIVHQISARIINTYSTTWYLDAVDITVQSTAQGTVLYCTPQYLRIVESQRRCFRAFTIIIITYHFRLLLIAISDQCSNHWGTEFERWQPSDLTIFEEEKKSRLFYF